MLVARSLAAAFAGALEFAEGQPVAFAVPNFAASTSGAERVIRVQLIPLPEHSSGVSFIERLVSNSLAQSILVLLATALITGLLVPIIKSRMDMQFFTEQKAHEARIVRQAEIIKEQTELLRQFVEVIWRFHFAMIQISYAKVTSVADSEFVILWRDYDNKSWICLNDLRRTISSGIHLVSPERFKELLKFYNEMLAEDGTLTADVQRKVQKQQEWLRSHTHLLYEVSGKIDAQVAALAEDLHLRTLPSAVARRD